MSSGSDGQPPKWLSERLSVFISLLALAVSVPSGLLSLSQYLGIPDDLKRAQQTLQAAREEADAARAAAESAREAANYSRAVARDAATQASVAVDQLKLFQRQVNAAEVSARAAERAAIAGEYAVRLSNRPATLPVQNGSVQGIEEIKASRLEILNKLRRKYIDSGKGLTPEILSGDFPPASYLNEQLASDRTPWRVILVKGRSVTTFP